MKINYFRDETIEENRVDIYYCRKDKELKNLMSFLNTDQVLLGKTDRSLQQLYLNEIYYIEVVDRHCFAYLESEVCEMDTSLKQFLEKNEIAGFLQIGKSTVVNMKKIAKIIPDFNMKMHLIMENGEQLVLNRTYKKAFMEFLKQKKGECQ